MSEDGASAASGPFPSTNDYPAPTLNDFDEDIPFEERQFCIERYTDLDKVKQVRMHCTACNKHLGLSAHNVNRLKMHPLLRTLICVDCLDFYNSGEFSKGEDGSELYCRWCGQGGQVYCCASCPVVFCENCIKRNFGAAKIEDIESIDDWNCFICNPKGLWCHRAALWAARRYCQIKNKLTLSVTMPAKRLQLQRECQIDESGCCKRKNKVANPNNKPPQSRSMTIQNKTNTPQNKTSTPQNKTTVMNKIKSPVPKTTPIKDMVTPISISEMKKPIKRQASPFRAKKISSVSQTILANLPNTLSVKTPSSIKKIATNPLQKQYKSQYATKINALKSKNMYSQQNFKPFNGALSTPFSMGQQDYFNPNDYLNLSLESLTHGIDVSNMQNNDMPSLNDDNVVCTPDFPLLEPMCEVNEDVEDDCTEISLKIDDDVQCLTPKIMPKPISALTDPVFTKHLDIDPKQIIQMTEKDVTVNKVTGGLKFRVDPATLSTNKMYQLPDGRIFAVNVNPKMPGGYSATIVTLSEQSQALLQRPGLTIRHPTNRNEPSILENTLNSRTKRTVNNPHNTRNKEHSWTKPFIAATNNSPKPDTPNDVKADKPTSKLRTRPQPLTKRNNPVEWYSYNLCDAIDLMEYVTKRSTRLKNLSKGHMKDRNFDEIKEMHYSLDKLLKISCQRFSEIRKNLTQDYKGWLNDRGSIELFSEDEENDDKITEDTNDNTTAKPSMICDEPIFIDENSEDSIKNQLNNHSETNHIDDVVPTNENTCEIIDDAETDKDQTNNAETIKEEIVNNNENGNESSFADITKLKHITIRRTSDKSIVKDPLNEILSSANKNIEKSSNIDPIDETVEDDSTNADESMEKEDDNSNNNLECDKKDDVDSEMNNADSVMNNADSVINPDTDTIDDINMDTNILSKDSDSDAFEKSTIEELLKDDNINCADTEAAADESILNSTEEPSDLNLLKNGDEHVDNDKCSDVNNDGDLVDDLLNVKIETDKDISNLSNVEENTPENPVTIID